MLRKFLDARGIGLAALALAVALTAAPGAAAAPRGDDGLGWAGPFAWLGEVLSSLFGASEGELGPDMDPDGSSAGGDLGPTMDPDG
jgi:hypothetical protein